MINLKNKLKRIIIFFSNFFKVVEKKNKKKFYYTVGLNFFAAIFEFLSVALIIPVIILLLKKEPIIEFGSLSFLLNDLNKINFTDQLILFIVVMNIFFFIRFLFTLHINKYKITFLNEIFVDISTKVFISNILNNYELLIKKTTPGIVKNIYFESDLFVKNIITTVVNLSFEIFKILAILLILLFIDPVSLIVGSIFFGFFTLIFLRFYKSKITTWGDNQIKSYEKMIQFINEGFQSVKEIKMIKNKSFFTEKFSYYVRNFVNAKINKEVTNSIPRPLYELLFIILVSIVILYYSFTLNNISEAAIVLGIFAVAFVRLLPSVMKLLNDFQNIFFALSVVEVIKDNIEVYEKLNKRSLIIEKNNFEKKIDKIELKNINYSYGESINPVIKNFSYSFKKNKIYGIFGASGSGKTTLVSLIMGLLKPTAGNLVINDNELESNSELIHYNTSYLPQKIFLLNDTIKKNIAFGYDDTEINEQKILKAIKMSNLNEILEKQENYLNFIISEYGKNLSEGQKQRLGFARIIYDSKQIIVLDEFTSSLDSKNEDLLLKNINLLKKDRIIFIISHKKEIKNICDDIIILGK